MRTVILFGARLALTNSPRSLSAIPPEEHAGSQESGNHTATRTEAGKEPSDTPGAVDHAADVHEAPTEKINGNGSGLKRTLRNRRLKEIPEPPPLPDWYLRDNVILRESLKFQDVAESYTTPLIKSSATSSEHGEEGAAAAAVSTERVALQPDELLASKKVDTTNSEMSGETEAALQPPSWASFEAQLAISASLVLAKPELAKCFGAIRTNLVIHCPAKGFSRDLDILVEELAGEAGADLVRLDALDIAELASGYLKEGTDAPGSLSKLGYEVYQSYRTSGPYDAMREMADHEEEDEDLDEMDEDEPPRGIGNLAGRVVFLGASAKGNGKTGLDQLREHIKHLTQTSGRVAMDSSGDGSRLTKDSVPRASYESFAQWDSLKLAALLESVIDSPSIKRAKAPVEAVSDQGSTGDITKHTRRASETAPIPPLRKWLGTTDSILTSVDEFMVPSADKMSLSASATTKNVASLKRLRSRKTVDRERTDTTDRSAVSPEPSKTIIHVRDWKELQATARGGLILERLLRVVRRRRREGEELMIVGTTSSADLVPEFTMSGISHLMNENESEWLRTLVVPPRAPAGGSEISPMKLASTKTLAESVNENADAEKVASINLRHLQEFASSLKLERADTISKEILENSSSMPGTATLGGRVWSYTEVQRIVHAAIGFCDDITAPQLIYRAIVLLQGVDNDIMAWVRSQRRNLANGDGSRKERPFGGDVVEELERSISSAAAARIQKVREDCTKHEERLLSGVVDPQNIKTTFADVHAPPDTIEAIKTLTTLSLLRPEAFKYGVLANDRLPGLLLYGPPGTGKTLLAKAVAKESQATVLEVTGAQIYEKYVGEGEKMVKAVFTLAKKLSPCIVFIDEADALFGSRNSAGNRTTHREIINQFLREWDGMDDHSVFMMVGTNRPFDLDDAVLRRLPRRLLVDLPIAKDREAILKIHLKGEDLDPLVDLAQLAARTQLYSGSDLKNLCVAAALACVREENEELAKNVSDPSFKLPDKRTLTLAHFEKAIAEISASISEDMSSLTAIRKFDEQYGDRRGRHKKTGYGFAGEQAAVVENDVRVRQDQRRP
ncbi:hypothetical protein LTR66_003393 [Elasticomyces elasticus]|nr:hypothetical protein LTR50_004099 [Elasticomyces elasticus]KAK4997137.1 hypothetical protein LTR66_003393 [Elasticomyces elasticus]